MAVLFAEWVLVLDKNKLNTPKHITYKCSNCGYTTAYPTTDCYKCSSIMKDE